MKPINTKEATITEPIIKRLCPLMANVGTTSPGVGNAEGTGVSEGLGSGVRVEIGDGVKHALPEVAQQARLVAFITAHTVRVAYSCVAKAVMVVKTETRVAASTVAVASL